MSFIYSNFPAEFLRFSFSKISTYFNSIASCNFLVNGRKKPWSRQWLLQYYFVAGKIFIARSNNSTAMKIQVMVL
jgi:hypothetical protein